jgi:hypothetical protein
MEFVCLLYEYFPFVLVASEDDQSTPKHAYLFNKIVW